jgi:hypothetical protein
MYELWRDEEQNDEEWKRERNPERIVVLNREERVKE